MRKKISLWSASLLTVLCVLANTIQTTTAEETYTVTKNTISKYDEFDYELWRDTGNASMTMTGGGTFQCSWDKEKTNNVLFRMGKKLGSTQTYHELGNITIDYGAKHEIYSGDVSYLCVYGWTEDPLIEFYVIENYGNYKPPGGVGFQGQIEVDGGIYDVYVDTRVDMPSIQGTKTFQQYFSVRRDKRCEGTISLSEHFKAWEEFGLDMSGDMYEVALCVEGYKSSGYANVYHHVLTIGDTVYGTPAKKPAGSDIPWIPVVAGSVLFLGGIAATIFMKKRK